MTNQHRRIRTGVIERLKSIRHPAGKGIWDKGIYLVPTPFYRTELREFGAPSLTIDVRDGSIRWLGGGRLPLDREDY